jgi:lipoyl synthase
MDRLPPWLHKKAPHGDLFCTLESCSGVNTVCSAAKCPNKLECFSKKVATFLLLGPKCSRRCSFCSIPFSKKPPPPDLQEPESVAMSCKKLELQHVVLTMVTRDDLDDGGASHLIATMRAVRKCTPATSVEVLTSDFNGNEKALKAIFDELPDIFNHNMETVARLTPRVRHVATFDRSLSILKSAKERGLLVKSGFMVGLGETPEEIEELLFILGGIRVDIVTIGQYLRPNSKCPAPKAFRTPEEFSIFSEMGKRAKIPYLYSGPYVRSSYNAGEIFQLIKKRENQ